MEAWDPDPVIDLRDIGFASDEIGGGSADLVGVGVGGMRLSNTRATGRVDSTNSRWVVSMSAVVVSYPFTLDKQGVWTDKCSMSALQVRT